MVAPMRVTVPSSTCGRSASCWALLKRWISSMNRIVRPPPMVRSLAGRGDRRARTSATPLMTAERVSKRAPTGVGEEPGEGRLAGARRAPQQDRAEVAARRRRAQRPALADEVLLADELLERPRSHPRGERLAARRRLEQGDLVGRRLAARHRASLGQATLDVGSHGRATERPSPGSGGSAAVSMPVDEGGDEAGVELGPGRRAEASEGLLEPTAPCGTGGSSSSRRTRRPTATRSGRSAGSPRRPGRRGSRCRPSARGGGGRPPGRSRRRAGRGRSRRRGRRAA